MIAGLNVFSIAAQTTFNPLDTGIVIAYVIGIIALGIWAGYRKNTSSTQLFLAGRSLRWPVIGISLFCANISSIHLVGLAADGHRVGMPVGNFEWGASFCLIILGLVFAPFYFRSKLQTLPEYVEKRYCPLTRTILGIIFILSALLVHIGISLYAGAKLMHEFFGINVYASIIVISGATAIYTVLGGLRAVMITNVVQVIILLLGSITLTVLGMKALGAEGITSFAQLKETVSPGIEPTMLQPITNATTGIRNEFSWLCVLVGYPVLGIWYWCTDQTIVQNILAAKTEKDGRDGAIFGGFMKILPVFLMVFPGVIAYALYHDKIGGDNNATLTVLMKELLPQGFLGLFAAGLLAALMSTVAAALNSTATLASSDILKRIKPDTSDRTMVWVGRITAVVVILLAMAWSTQGARFGSIFEAINKIPMMFAPGITTIFLFGVFWKRGTKQAAIAALLFNMGVGIVYLLFDIPIIGSTRIVADTWDIPFMLVGGIFFVACFLLYVIVSLLTPAPAPEKLENLVWKRPLEFILYGKIKGITDPRVMAGMLFALMIVLYIILG
jgi:SSS family solute:Na+ symporter